MDAGHEAALRLRAVDCQRVLHLAEELVDVQRVQLDLVGILPALDAEIRIRIHVL